MQKQWEKASMGKSNKQFSPKLSNCLILHCRIIGLEGIQQIQEECYSTCQIHQSDESSIGNGGMITFGLKILHLKNR